MKNLILLFLAATVLFSCRKEEEKEPLIGYCEEGVKISSYKNTFSSKGDSVKIKAINVSSFKFYVISINGTPEYELPKSMQFVSKLSPDSAENKFALIERQDNNHLFIKMKENTSKEKVVLEVGLQSGNCHSKAITITQEAGN